MTQVDKNVYSPLIIAAGGGGRGYSSRLETQLEQMDYYPSQLGRNGKSYAAGTFLWSAQRNIMCKCCYVSIHSEVCCAWAIEQRRMNRWLISHYSTLVYRAHLSPIHGVFTCSLLHPAKVMSSVYTWFEVELLICTSTCTCKNIYLSWRCLPLS